ncbi:MAG: transposase [Cyanobacteria bacterium P01_G01_bin.19]
MITAEKNRRRGKTNSVQVSIDEHIEWLEQQLKEIESHPRQFLYESKAIRFAATDPQDRTVSQIKSASAKCEDWKQKKKLLTSVPGVGEIVATTLISSWLELGKLSHKSISYLVGLAPLNRVKIIDQPSNELINAQTSKKF